MKDTPKDWKMILFVAGVFSLAGWLALNVAKTLDDRGSRWVIEQIKMVPFERVP